MVTYAFLTSALQGTEWLTSRPDRSILGERASGNQDNMEFYSYRVRHKNKDKWCEKVKAGLSITFPTV
jgi:hypothetical protein